MMKKIILLLLIAFFAVIACSDPPIEKPENLINEDTMVDILVDVHMAEAAFTTLRHRDSLVERSSSADFYYSILQEHEVQDSVFEKSLVFYASQPRRFEKMYRQVMNQLTQIEQEYSGRKSEMQELEIQSQRE